MATVIVVETKGFDTVFAVLDRLGQPNWNRLLRLIGMRVQEQTIMHFQQQAGPDGRWKPTKRGGQILVNTGHLRSSISHLLGHNEVRIGTSVHYGKFHQFGTSRMPARAFLGLTVADRNELQQTIEGYIEGLLRP